jgi:hypothetical protein
MNMTATHQSESISTQSASEGRRYVVITAVAAMWMAIGWIFGIGGNVCLLLGVPLPWVFQRYAARRPLLVPVFAHAFIDAVRNALQ